MMRVYILLSKRSAGSAVPVALHHSRAMQWMNSLSALVEELYEIPLITMHSFWGRRSPRRASGAFGLRDAFRRGRRSLPGRLVSSATNASTMAMLATWTMPKAMRLGVIE